MFRSRWRAKIRKLTPDFLYDRGLVVPKARDCGAHDWYFATAIRDDCYHCEVSRPHDGDDLMRRMSRSN